MRSVTSLRLSTEDGLWTVSRVWFNLQVQGDCYVVFGSIRDFVDANLVGDVGHFVLCIYSCCPHFRWARVVEIRSFVDCFRQRPFQDLGASSVEMLFSPMNPAYLHHTVCVCMIVYRAAFTRSPDQDELCGYPSTSSPLITLFGILDCSFRFLHPLDCVCSAC